MNLSLHYTIAMLLITLGLYCILTKHNLIKIVIGLGVLTNGIHLFLISLGFREGGIAPILTSGISQGQFIAQAVDPIPQAFVLTSIVIDVCVTALALSLAIHIYRQYGTLNPFEIRRLRE